MWSKSCSQQTLISLKPVKMQGSGKRLQKERRFGRLQEAPTLLGALLKSLLAELLKITENWVEGHCKEAILDAIAVPFLKVPVQSLVKYPETETPRASAQQLQLHHPKLCWVLSVTWAHYFCPTHSYNGEFFFFFSLIPLNSSSLLQEEYNHLFWPTQGQVVVLGPCSPQLLSLLNSLQGIQDLKMPPSWMQYFKLKFYWC